MRSMKVFISGRVTGLPREVAVRNFERGKKICMLNGFNFVSPVDKVPTAATPSQAMKICFNALFDCDAILLLNGHNFSEGSKLEEAVARYCKKKIFDEDDLN